MEPDTFHVTEGCRSRRDKAHARSGTAPVMPMNVVNEFVSPELETAPMMRPEWEELM